MPVIDEDAFPACTQKLVQNGQLPLLTDVAEAIDYTTPPQTGRFMQWIVNMCIRMTTRRNELIKLIHSIPKDDWVFFDGNLPEALCGIGDIMNNGLHNLAAAGNANARLILNDRDVMLATVSHDGTF